MPGTQRNPDESPAPKKTKPSFPGMEIPGAKNAKGAKTRSAQEVSDIRELNEEKNAEETGESNQH